MEPVSETPPKKQRTSSLPNNLGCIETFDVNGFHVKGFPAAP